MKSLKKEFKRDLKVLPKKRKDRIASMAYLTPKMYLDLKKTAVNLGVSASFIVCAALEEYLYDNN